MKHLLTTLCLAGASLFSTAFANTLENYTLDPASGSTLESLSEISITFTDYNPANSNDMLMGSSVTGTISNGTTSYSVAQMAGAEKNSKKLYFRSATGFGSEIITEAGEWTLSYSRRRILQE